MRLALSAFLAAFVAFASPQAQDPRAAGVVAGIVLDAAGAGVPGATVQLRAGARVERSAASNERGEFRFEKLLPAQYEIRVAKAGFEPLTRSIDVVPDRPAYIRLTLSAIGASSEALKDADQRRSSPNAAPVGRPETTAKPDSAGSREVPPPPAAPTIHGGLAGTGRGGGAEGRPRYSIPDYNTEAYDTIDENRFRHVLEDPLSTFSVDVDTASYANVRRFLNEGRLPPPDAVRIEELINYFRFDYSSREPNGRQTEILDAAPFSITTEVAACPWNPRHKLALIGLRAQKLSLERTPPRNLVFLLDVSGSMAPANKLPLVKTAMRMLTDTLTAADRVAIVVYAGASGLALPSTSGHRKPEIRQAIADLRAGGSTNGAAGIRLAYDVVSDAFIKDGINRVILATDGDFNVGVTSQDELIRLIEAKRERGIFLSVLGVGTGNLKDSTMEKLADRGNGNYAYLDTLQEARRVLIAESGATLATVAKDVKIQVEFNPRTVGAYKLIGYENRILRHRDFNNDRKDAGEIGAGHTVTALYEVVPPGESIGGGIDPLRYQDRPAQERVYPNAASKSSELMTVKLRYKQPDGDVSKLMTRPVHDRTGALTANIGFAAAVAEFGMLLRNSDFRGAATWASAHELVRRHRGEDPDGYRAEFIRMIELAAALDRRAVHTDDRRR